MKTKREVIIPPREYNQILKFSTDNDLLKIFAQQRDILRGLPEKKAPIKFRVDSIKKIRTYLIKKGLPLAWKEPLYNMLVSKYQLDFPLDNSISLMVGSQEITGATSEILLIKNSRTNELLGEEASLSLVITSKVSTEKIIQFVKRHKEEIEYWQGILDLPNYKNPLWSNPDLALKIIQMKDEQNLSFGEISDRLSDNENLSKKQIDYLATENNIKTLYYRFKKFLKQ